MKQKLYLILACILLLQTVNVHAQTCADGRYYREIFNEAMTTVTYSDTFNLQMDIYQPTSDTLSARPLIILAHEGTFVGGDKGTDATVDSLCVRFAKRGYVTASINYRLSTLGAMISDSSSAITEVIQAISDGKAAIRYFVKDRATSNTYKIDTNNIFIGGNSAGAVLYMHVGYMQDTVGLPAYIITALDSNGGFEGNSGNAGYTTKSKGIIDLAGGLNHVSFVRPGGKPSVNCQGDQDNIVPYTCADAYGGVIHVELCGLGSLLPQYTADAITNLSMVFPGAGHVPWDTNPEEFNTVDSLISVFLYNYSCPGMTEPSSVSNVQMYTDVTLYPNPANDVLNLAASQAVKEISVYDETGRTVFQVSGINATRYAINTSHFSAGLYFVKMKFSNEDNAPMVKRIVIE